MKLKPKNKYEKRAVFFILILILFLIFLLSLGIIFIYKLNHPTPPRFFTFNDSQAKYKIVKLSDWGEIYGIEYKTKSKNNISYDCPQKLRLDIKKDCKKIINQEYTVAVGNSPFELKKYLNKYVVINGKFAYVNQQCINSKCTKTNNMLGVDIISIKKN